MWSRNLLFYKHNPFHSPLYDPNVLPGVPFLCSELVVIFGNDILSSGFSNVFGTLWTCSSPSHVDVALCIFCQLQHIVGEHLSSSSHSTASTIRSQSSKAQSPPCRLHLPTKISFQHSVGSHNEATGPLFCLISYIQTAVAMIGLEMLLRFTCVPSAATVSAKTIALQL